MTHKLLIRLVDAEYAITRLNIGTPLPEWLMGPGFWTVSSSREEMTLVCRATRIPSNVQSSGGWRCLRIEQHFSFDVPGVLASVLNPLYGGGRRHLRQFDLQHRLCVHHRLGPRQGRCGVEGAWPRDHDLSRLLSRSSLFPLTKR